MISSFKRLQIFPKWLLISIGVFAVAAGIVGVMVFTTDQVKLANGADVTLKVADAHLTATVAKDPPTQARGVAGLEGLAEDRAMLFVFERPQILTFWMKDVRFPIDMMWIRENRVIDITPNVPPAPPGTPESQLPRYQPKEPADRVLEVAAGWSERHGVKLGASVNVEQ